MIFVPTRDKRNVLIAIKATASTAGRTEHRSSGTARIAHICALFCDHEGVEEGVYKDSNEALLLLKFWMAIRSTDRIFTADVVKGMALVRARTWALHVLPSAEIDLRQVYNPELHDSATMWAKKLNSTTLRIQS